MQISRILYVKDRQAWRKWLERHHTKAKEIWLIYYNKESGKPRIPYGDAVEEALCFGWIDSTVKKIDADSHAQRWTPRRPGSVLSQMNRERVHMMIEQKKMTKAGMDAIAHRWKEKFVFPDDIKQALQKDPIVWKHFQAFPKHYQRIRVAFIDGARNRPKEFDRRLQNFIKKTRLKKKFGMMH